jgi:alkanesulfonate monooxygenase SsuD/methylene tetrahydromethanopterin reductase-like flavin-dependent oxidoreductase (luciferase family)
VYFADHFMPNDLGGEPLDGPVLECWSVMAGLAAATEQLRIGSLVCGNLYRHPAVVANAASTVDHISGGRFVLGVGAGWQVNEHEAYGIDLLDTKARLDRFEAACAVLTSLLREQRTTLEADVYRITNAPCDPKPVQSPLPLLVGGKGERRTMRIAARYADEWNAWTTPDEFRQKIDVLARHCNDLERDPSSIHRSTQALMYLSTDESWLARFRDRDPVRPVIVGTPAEVVEQVAAYRDAGVDELIVPDWTMGKPPRAQDTLELFWTEVAPAVS